MRACYKGNGSDKRGFSMSRHIKAVLCDVDGTIIDSFRYGLQKLSISAEQHGYAYTDDMERLAVSIWGSPLKSILHQCFPDASESVISSMMGIFSRLDREAAPTAIEGVHATLEFLASLGIIFTIITSRDSESLDGLLKGEKLDHHFCHIAAEDTVEHRKPDRRVFDCTMRLLAEKGIDPDECLLIGDTYDDFRAGQNFGMRTVIVRTGPLSEDQPDIPAANHISSFAELPAWLARNNLCVAA